MRRHSQHGFTLIELMLAMAFVSILLMAIIAITIQTGRLYDRGLTLKSVNQAGRDIGDTLRRDFLQANAGKMSGNDQEAVIMIQTAGEDRSGRLCLGGYSYVWNTPKAMTRDSAAPGIVTEIGGPTAGRPINLVRVIDPDGALCQRDTVTGSYRNTVATDKITHLLKPAGMNDVVLAIHSLHVSRVTRDDSRGSLYWLRFTIGTSQLEAIDTADGTCKPPADGSNNFNFCAINSFETIVRTNG